MTLSWKITNLSFIRLTSHFLLSFIDQKRLTVSPSPLGIYTARSKLLSHAAHDGLHSTFDGYLSGLSLDTADHASVKVITSAHDCLNP